MLVLVRMTTLMTWKTDETGIQAARFAESSIASSFCTRRRDVNVLALFVSYTRGIRAL
jgi:hypothetical protein